MANGLEVEMKICNKCNINKIIDCFSRHSPSRLEKRKYCKKCATQATTAYELRHPNRELTYRLNKNFSMSKEEYDIILINQNNKCATCEKMFDNSNASKICVDHDHKTNKVRGLLCFNCNTTLGKVHDNIRTLTNMIKYLEKNR
jgi:hypothetical protein